MYSDGNHHDYVKIPDNIILHPTGDNINDSYEQQLIRTTFPDIDLPTFSPDIFEDRAILCPLNVDINKINTLATDMFHSDKAETYTSVDYTDINPDQAVHFPPEFLNTLDISSIYHHTNLH